MCRTLSAVLLVVFFGSLSFSAGQQTGDADRHLKMLQGTWQVVGMEMRGQKAPEEKLKEADIKLIIKDGKYSQSVAGTVMEEGTFKLDPSKKPATMDFLIQTGKDKGKTQLAVYEIKGGTWRIHVAEPGTDKRPTSLTSKEDDEGAIMTLKRQKKGT